MRKLLLALVALLASCSISTCPDSPKEIVREILRVDTVLVHDTVRVVVPPESCGKDDPLCLFTDRPRANGREGETKINSSGQLVIVRNGKWQAAGVGGPLEERKAYIKVGQTIYERPQHLPGDTCVHSSGRVLVFSGRFVWDAPGKDQLFSMEKAGWSQLEGSGKAPVEPFTRIKVACQERTL